MHPERGRAEQSETRRNKKNFKTIHKTLKSFSFFSDCNLHKELRSANSLKVLLFFVHSIWASISMMIIFVFSFQVSYYFNVYSALSGLCIILALVATPSAQLAGSHSRRRLHDRLVGSVMRNSLHFFQSTPFGRIINRFSYDMSIIDKVCSIALWWLVDVPLMWLREGNFGSITGTTLYIAAQQMTQQ